MKPIHIKCPNCQKEITINDNPIERDYDRAKAKRMAITTEITKMKAEPGFTKRNPRYKRLVEIKTDLDMQLSAIKTARKNLYTHEDKEILEAFKEIIKRELGEPRYKKLFEEAKEEVRYNDFELAKQRYNRFTNL